MFVGASADLINLEEEYPAWIAFSHMITPIPCIITRHLYIRHYYKTVPKKLIIISEKNLEGVSFHYLPK